jgi:hypothetical protein
MPLTVNKRTGFLGIVFLIQVSDGDFRTLFAIRKATLWRCHRLSHIQDGITIANRLCIIHV